MIRDFYKKAADEIEMDKELIKNTVEKIVIENTKSKKNVKFAPVAVIAIIIMIFPILVYAKIIDLESLFSYFFKDNNNYIGQFETKLVGLTETFEGFKIELLSTTKDYDTVYLLMSVTDTTEDRLNEDSTVIFNFDDAGIWSWNDVRLSYDKKSKTAYFMLYAKGVDIETTTNLKFKPKYILNTEIKNQGKLNLYDLLKNHKYSTYFDEYAYDRTIIGENFDDYEIIQGRTLLEKDELDVVLVDTEDYKVKITNIGIIDGQLNFQTFSKEPKYQDPNYMDIVDINDDYVEHYGDFIYEDTVQIDDDYYIYRNYIIENINNIEDLKGLYLKTQWRDTKELVIFPGFEMSFNIPKEVRNIELPFEKDIKIGDIVLSNNKFIISPIEIRLFADITEKHFDNIRDFENIEVKFKDGTKIKLEQEDARLEADSHYSGGNNPDNVIRIFISFGKDVLELENIKSIIVNNQELKIDN